MASDQLRTIAWRVRCGTIAVLRNKLAVFGMVVVIVIVIAASFIGPTVIKRVVGLRLRFHSHERSSLTKSFPPFTGPDGEFSWTHPMGTDNRRPRHAGAGAAGRTDLADGRHHRDARVAAHRRHLRRDRRISRRADRRSDDAHRRRALFAAVHDRRDRAAGAVSQPDAARAAGPAVHRARRGLVADDGAHRSRAGDVAEEPGICAGGASDRRFDTRESSFDIWCRTRSGR